MIKIVLNLRTKSASNVRKAFILTKKVNVQDLTYSVRVLTSIMGTVQHVMVDTSSKMVNA